MGPPLGKKINVAAAAQPFPAPLPTPSAASLVTTDDTAIRKMTLQPNLEQTLSNNNDNGGPPEVLQQNISQTNSNPIQQGPNSQKTQLPTTVLWPEGGQNQKRPSQPAGVPGGKKMSVAGPGQLADGKKQSVVNKDIKKSSSSSSEASLAGLNAALVHRLYDPADLVMNDDRGRRYSHRAMHYLGDRIEDTDMCFFTMKPRGLPDDCTIKGNYVTVCRQHVILGPKGSQIEKIRLPVLKPEKTQSDDDNLILLPGPTQFEATQHLVNPDDPQGYTEYLKAKTEWEKIRPPSVSSGETIKSSSTDTDEKVTKNVLKERLLKEKEEKMLLQKSVITMNKTSAVTISEAPKGAELPSKEKIELTGQEKKNEAGLIVAGAENKGTKGEENKEKGDAGKDIKKDNADGDNKKVEGRAGTKVGEPKKPVEKIGDGDDVNQKAKPGEIAKPNLNLTTEVNKGKPQEKENEKNIPPLPPPKNITDFGNGKNTWLHNARDYEGEDSSSYYGSGSSSSFSSSYSSSSSSSSSSSQSKSKAKKGGKKSTVSEPENNGGGNTGNNGMVQMGNNGMGNNPMMGGGIGMNPMMGGAMMNPMMNMGMMNPMMNMGMMNPMTSMGANMMDPMMLGMMMGMLSQYGCCPQQTQQPPVYNPCYSCSYPPPPPCAPYGAPYGYDGYYDYGSCCDPAPPCTDNEPGHYSSRKKCSKKKKSKCLKKNKHSKSGSQIKKGTHSKRSASSHKKIIHKPKNPNHNREEDMNFAFLPQRGCVAEVTLTMDPDEPDPLLYAVTNGAMPIVCCQMPPTLMMGQP